MKGDSLVLIAGPGAVGGVLAARWIESGQDVALLARRARHETALRRQGLAFVGTSGRERLLRRGLLGARSLAPRPARAVFLCAKAQDVAAAARAARRWIGPDTAVVCLQNGVGHERLVRRAFGPARAVIGVCYVAADRSGPRRVLHNGGRDIRLARYPGNEAALKTAASLLRRAGWSVAVEPSEDAMLWTKLCFNAAGNPLGAVCAVPNGELVRDPALKALLSRATQEAVTAARRDGHRIDGERMKRLILKTYPLDSRQRNSMLQDLQAKRRTEVDAIVGPILAAARRRGVKAPVLACLRGLVKRLEALP